MAETLPEGTDHIVPGASATEPDRTIEESANSIGGKSDVPGGDLRERISAQAGEYRTQATDKARDFASQGKERASGALAEVARLIGENATQIDDKVGSQYGDYARKAADAVSGAADALRGKDIDELIEDARNVIRQSPALAIGAAAAAGFFLARVIKSGSDSLAEAAKTSKATGASAADTGATKSGGAAKSSTDAPSTTH